MTPSLKRLQSFADITIIMGPLLLVIGILFTSIGGIMSVIGGAAAVIGGILLFAGLIYRAIELGVRALGEAMAERAGEPAADVAVEASAPTA